MQLKIEKLKENIKKMNSLSSSSDYEQIYDQRQMMVILTEQNILIGIDTKKGEQKWRVRLGQSISDVYQLEYKLNDQIFNDLVITIVSPHQLSILKLDVKTGQTLSQDQRTLSTSKVIKLAKQQHNHQEALLILDTNNLISYYPTHYLYNNHVKV